MARRWIITAVGQDRPGIVAGVTKTLFEHGCNLEDSAMTRLAGEFAIMLIFSGPGTMTERSLRRALEPLARRLRLAAHLKPLTKQEAARPRKRGRSYLISVYGKDRPGIVYRISDVLARNRANITDVHTHRSRRGRPSLYLTLLEVEVPPARPIASLERQLATAARRLGVEVSLRPAEVNVL